MKFETEIDLVNVLRDHLTKHYKVGDNIKIFEEVSLGFGIADLVVTNFISDMSTISNSHFKLDTNDINVYDLISKNINGITGRENGVRTSDKEQDYLGLFCTLRSINS